MRRASPNAMVQNEDEHRPSSRIPIEKHTARHPRQRGEDKHCPPCLPSRRIVG